MLICITNDIRDMHSCTIRGEHLSTCDGQDWSNTPTGPVECNGCLPRPASHGLLCTSCWEKLDATEGALAISLDLITHLRFVEKGPADTSGVRTAPGSRVILPASWMEADNLYTRLAGVAIAYSMDWDVEEPDWDPTASILDGFMPSASIEAVKLAVEQLLTYVRADPERLVAKATGAEHAVRYVRAVQTALARFPLEMKPRPVRYIRCRECKQNTLMELPPLMYGDPIVIECRNLACKAIYDPQMIEFDLRLYRQEVEEQLAAKALTERNAA